MDLSVIVPVYNEEAVIERFYERLTEVLHDCGLCYEVIAIDDGSRDRTLEILLRLHRRDRRLRIIQLSRNFGQHPALAAGLSLARGKIAVTIDADLQIDPGYIPEFVAKINEGYDFVSGIRTGSGDSFLFRRLPSLLVNFLVGWAAGKPLRDYGCPLNAMTRQVVRQLPEYGEMQRFFKPLAVRIADRVAELKVRHEERKAGRSKYCVLSLVDLFFDFVTNFSRQLFQRVALAGLMLSGIAFLVGLLYLALRFVFCIIGHPMERLLALLLLGFGFGVQLLILGVLGDFVIRTYRKIEPAPLYRIEKVWESSPEPDG